MEHPLLVFISSVISGMAAERQAAQAAIQAIPLTRPWLFEFSGASSLPLDESYLRKVRECDILVLLLETRVTDPVEAEVQTAQDNGKPLLVFLYDGAPADVVTKAQSLGVKYAPYRDAADLAQKVAEAVADELIIGYRRHSLPRADLGALGDFLDGLTQGQARIEVGGDQIVTTGPVATRESAISTGSGSAVVGNGNVVITGKVGGNVNVGGQYQEARRSAGTTCSSSWRISGSRSPVFNPMSWPKTIGAMPWTLSKRSPSRRSGSSPRPSGSSKDSTLVNRIIEAAKGPAKAAAALAPLVAQAIQMAQALFR